MSPEDAPVNSNTSRDGTEGDALAHRPGVDAVQKNFIRAPWRTDPTGVPRRASASATVIGQAIVN